MSELITISINKDKKKFTPKLKKRKTKAKEETKEQVMPVEQPQVDPHLTKVIKKDELTTEPFDTEYIDELTRLYPDLNQTAQKGLKRPKSTLDCNSADSGTPEKRRKKLETVQEKILSEHEKIILGTIKKKRLRESGGQLSQTELVPQAKLVDGKITLDPSSLSVSRDKCGIENLVLEQQDITLKTHWSELETQVFYDGLALYGTDFTAISNTLIGRNRKSVMKKFRSEQARCPQKITSYLLKKKSPATPDSN